ncbi:zinc finger protein 532-like [Lytechinus variegatus]|uniref:zinc finger protein 532-like n=1 Tax=Lytechinus variegatus TaxID=7654 RepID=UPI001BB1F3CF|nr:zinc finger protein 532-like [Lytechinus variegatus]
MASPDPVQEEMGDILSAFGIPDLAKHIVPIPLPPLDVDDEEPTGGSRGDPEGEDPEKDHPKKEEEEAEGGDTSKDRDEDEGDDDQDEGTKAQEAEEITDDKENPEEDMAMETDEGTDSITDVSQNEDEAPSQDRKIETSMKQPQKAVPDLGLKQSVASLHEDETGAQKTSLIKELLKSTSKPVMTSRLQGDLHPPDTSLDVPEEPDMEDNPESLTSVDEFNSFLDRHKESRELRAMKLAMLEKTNSVATYQCPVLTKEQMKVLDMDNTTFQCPGCNDTYLFKASLDAHLNRRTVLVTFRCKFCTGRKNLVFYNKCTFLAHLHYHNAPESDIENIKSQASISPVNALACLKAYTMLTAPEKKKVTTNKSSVVSHAALKNPLTPSITHSTTTSKQYDTPPSAVKTQVITSNKARTVVLHPKNTNQLQLVQKDGQTSYLCMGCNVRYEKMIHLSSHLGRSDHVPKAKYGHKACLHQCNVCKLLLGNTCKLKMHSLIHNDQIKPMPCPECGCLFTDLKSLLIHQNDGCLHWMTRPLFKCCFCNKYATTFAGLVKHFEQCHVESFFKCPLCQLAFRTKQSANEHSLQIHKLSNNVYSLLRKCPFCKSVYSEGGMLLNHFDGHFKEGLIKIEKFVYTCPLCNRPFDYNLALLNHLKNEHGRSSTNMFTCDLCLSPFSSVTNLMIHRQNCHIKPNKELRNSEPERKNLGQSAGNTIVCGECGEKLPKFDMDALQKHMFEKHGGQVKNSLATQMKKEVTTIDKVQEDATRPKGSGEPAKDSSVTKAEATKVTVSRFTDQQCAKCQFKSKDRLVFEKHIRGHKAEDSLNQCHECGLCFTVSMSLKKHLFIKHKIKNMDLYNTTYDDLIPRWEDDMKKKKLEEKEKERESTKSDMKEEDDGKAEAALEEKDNAEEEKVEESSLFKCKVCKVEFENEKALTVHARSHGLAYLQHTLSRSPEKAARMLNSKPATSSPQSTEVVEKPKTSPVVKRMLPSDTDSSTSSDEGSSIEDQNGN